MIENAKREREGLVRFVKYNEDTLHLPMFVFQLMSCFSGLFYKTVFGFSTKNKEVKIRSHR